MGDLTMIPLSLVEPDYASDWEGKLALDEQEKQNSELKGPVQGVVTDL